MMRNTAMIALLIILLHWPDTSRAYHMLVGFPALWYAPRCQVLGTKPAERVAQSTPPMAWGELRKVTHRRQQHLIQRFAITQASGKMRVIDDAADGEQSDTPEDANKLRLCSALQPAHHLAILRQE